MKMLFFDMEFADGKVPGSIYSFGYLVTDEDFRILVPPTDLLMDPESSWNEYVAQNILAYPMDEVKSAPPFPSHYPVLAQLFREVDVAVGFSLSNDNHALVKDCNRYLLPPLSYSYFDVEKLCKLQKEHKSAHGLGGYHAAWCGSEAENAHRSDGDAYATMELFRAICRANHVTAEMMLAAYPECMGNTSIPKEKKKNNQKGKRRRRPRTSKGKSASQKSQASEKGE